MSKKWEIIQKITDSGLVVVVRADNPDMAKKITDACLPAVARLEKLEVLWLDNTVVSDACLVSLKRMTHLKTLHAENTKISNKGFIELRAALKQTKIFGNGPIEASKEDASKEDATPPADSPAEDLPTPPAVEKDGRR